MATDRHGLPARRHRQSPIQVLTAVTGPNYADRDQSVTAKPPLHPTMLTLKATS